MADFTLKKRVLFMSLIGTLFFLPVIPVSAAEEMVFDFEARSGVVIAYNFYGEIEFSVSSPEEIERLEVFFDDKRVHTEDDDHLNWVFDTTDYDSGETTIKVIAYDDEGDEMEKTQEVTFLTEEESNNAIWTVILSIMGLIAAIVGVIAIIYYIRRRK